MKCYLGVRNGNAAVVTVDGKKLNPRFDLWRHSPSGFEWGYAGSGPAQLALALLADCLGDAKAIEWNQPFEDEVVARMAHAGWTLTEEEIRKTVAALKEGDLQSFRNCVIHGDCIEVLDGVPGESVGLVLTDPPYLAHYVCRDGRRIANDDHDRWIRPAFTEIFRVLKSDRFCVSFYGWQQAEKFLWHSKKIGFVPVGHFVFVKDYASKSGFLRSHHEQAYLLAKGKPKHPAEPLRDVIQWTYSGNTLHPNQKPVSVLVPLIVALSQPGDLVLDPFCGSGTTGVATKMCGRQYLLIETLRQYFEAARDRLVQGGG